MSFRRCSIFSKNHTRHAPRKKLSGPTPDISTSAASATASGTATKLHGCLVGLGDPWLVDNLGRVLRKKKGLQDDGSWFKLQVLHGNGVKSGVTYMFVSMGMLQVIFAHNHTLVPVMTYRLVDILRQPHVCMTCMFRKLLIISYES